MEEFLWSEAMSVGVPELDADHRKLIDLLSEVGRCVELNHADMTHEILLALFTYVKEHFAREERYMNDIGFPGLAAHQALHDLLEQDIIEALEDQDVAGDPDLALRVHSFLIHWLTRHILQEDQAYARFTRRFL
jgi:hemerythrin